MNGVLTLGPSDLDIDDIYGDLEFPEGKAGLPYVVLNVVSTVDGRATIGGRSNRVGTDVDHRLMRKIRAAADMVLIGAGTLRGENVDFRLAPELQQKRIASGKSPAPIAAVLSASAELPLDRTFFQSKEFEAIVFVTKRANPRQVELIEKHAKVMVVGDKTIDISILAQVLVRDLGVRRLVVEGGPSLYHAFIASRLADELFFTLSPKITAGRELTPVEGPRFPGDGVVPLRLVSAFAYQNEIFLRYEFLPPVLR